MTKIIDEENYREICRKAKRKKVWNEIEKRIREYPNSSLVARKNYVKWIKLSEAVVYFNFLNYSIRADILRGNGFKLNGPRGLARKNDKEKKLQYSIDMGDHETADRLDYIFSLLKQKYDSI